MMDEDDLDSDDHESGFPRPFHPTDLGKSLRTLKYLGDDPYLSIQVTNLEIVDNFLTDLESETLRAYFSEERHGPANLIFLSAQTQMWIFAVYELLRTWRERANTKLKLVDNGGLDMKIQHLESKSGPSDFGSQIRAKQLKSIRDNPEIGEVIKEDLRRVHVPFRNIEALRISMAKHEIAGVRNSIAHMPGYGRLDYKSGSLSYELSVGNAIYDYISRRQIADGLRAMFDDDAPSDEDISSYEEAMKELRKIGKDGWSS